jgi:hypothetical protein
VKLDKEERNLNVKLEKEERKPYCEAGEGREKSLC